MKHVNFILLMGIVCAVSAQDPRQRRCPGGFGEGDTTTLGRYWYECRDGQLVQKGCLDEQGRRVNIMESFDTTNRAFRLQCVLDASGYLSFSYKACLVDGREHVPGEEWEDGKYYYRCDRDGDSLQINTAGCMDQGRRVAIQERVTKGSFIYQCRRSVNGTCSMCPVACTKNGREYAIGDSFELDNLVYTCTNVGVPIAIKVIGCLNDRREHLRDGDRYHRDDVIYECTVRNDEAETKPVGCVQRENGVEIERRLDCFWTEGNAPYQYEMTCKLDPITKRATKVPYRCTYKPSQGGTYSLDANCYQLVENSIIACKKESNDQLNLRVFPFNQINDVTAQGYRSC